MESLCVVSRRTCEHDGVSFQSEPVNDACTRVMWDQLAVLGDEQSQVGTQEGNRHSLVLGRSPPS